MFKKLIDNWKITAPFAVVGAAIVAFLAFGVFGIHTAFIDDVVDEAGPVFDSGASAGTDESTTQVTVSEETLDQIDEVMEDEAIPTEVVMDEENPMPEESAPGEIVTLFDGQFSGLSRYDVEGTVNVLNDGTAQRFLRFEDDFAGNNGPDLNVYLTRADDGIGGDGDWIDLGDLRGNIGSQNYEIPEDVDLSEFDTVVIWCVRFGVGFGEAELMTTSA